MNNTILQNTVNGYFGNFRVIRKKKYTTLEAEIRRMHGVNAEYYLHQHKVWGSIVPLDTKIEVR